MTRVLVVDDDCDHAESLADVIEMRGHTAQIANSGEEALDMFRADDFDFVLVRDRVCVLVLISLINEGNSWLAWVRPGVDHT